jgi:putative transcriptional regulator
VHRLTLALAKVRSFVKSEILKNGGEQRGVKKLHRAIGNDICRRKKSLLVAEEIKFLRKELRLKAKELAAILGVTDSTMSRWENGKKQIGEGQDRLLRSI